MLKKPVNNKCVIIGADSETNAGPPISFQFWAPEKKYQALIWVNKNNSFKKFMTYLNSLQQNTYLMFAHNLAFDLISFFYSCVSVLDTTEIDVEYENWHIKGIYSNICFLTFTKKVNDKGNGFHTSIHLIDTSAYFMGSLKDLAPIFTNLKKLNPPKLLGDKKFTKNDKKFCSYAMRDAEICWYIGKYIQDIHIEYDIPISISGPQMASKIFRKDFMKKDIPYPDKIVTFSALHSYHGGRNNITKPKGLYKNVWGLDIISAYPYAMSLLPSFYDKSLYKSIIPNINLDEKKPEYGIYKISGNYKKCPWPVLYNEKFKPLDGKFSNIWVTGFELNSALKYNEVELEKIEGYYYDSEKDKEVSPFAEYVKLFFEYKNTSKNEIKRQFYKICLNSLYGKFIQTVDKQNGYYYDVSKERVISKDIRQAGGLFHPFIATLITGKVRQMIHDLEHKYKSIHTSTDGIITQIKPDINDLKSGLGGLKVEFEGDCQLFRNKLYIIYNKKHEKIKYALHGFHAKVDLLEKLHKKGVYDYEFTRVNKLRESLNRGLVVNKFEKHAATLKF